MSASYMCSIEDGAGQARAASRIKQEREEESCRGRGMLQVYRGAQRNYRETVSRCTGVARRSPPRRVLAAMGGMSKEAWRDDAAASRTRVCGVR